MPWICFSMLVVVSGTTCPTEAPPDYTYINNKYYKFETSQVKAYWEAMQDCKGAGARLAMMETLDVYTAVWLNIVTSKLCTHETCDQVVFCITQSF